MRLKKKKENGERERKRQEKRANKRFGSVENKRQLALVNTLEGRGGVRAAGKVQCLPESIQIWSQKLLKVLAKRSFPLPAKWQFELSCWVPFFSFLSLRFVLFLPYHVPSGHCCLIWFCHAPRREAASARVAALEHERERTPEGERSSKKKLISNCAAKALMI